MKTDRHETRSGDLSVRFWGTRGSMPRPGPDTLRYGGNTTCLEVRLGGRLFIIDAGSGIEAAGRALAVRDTLKVDVLFSHLHHDHVSGLPFFPPALNPNTLIRTFCGNLGGDSAEAAFGNMFAPPLFPINLGMLPSTFEHVGFRAGDVLTFEDGLSVRTCPLRHPGGATAFRFDHGGRTLCCLSDLEHVPGVPDPMLVAFCAGADLVIYDTMFVESEFQACRGWGHSTWSAGVALCREAGAKALAATHHHIRHTDVMLEAMEADLTAAFPGSFVAREGQTITLSAAASRPKRLRLSEAGAV